MALMIIAIKILTDAYSLRIEISVVSVPAPAIKGKAIGTILADSGSTSLYIRTPRIISNARKNKISAPATANEATLTPNSAKSSSPINKKITIIEHAAIVAFSDCICPTLSLTDIIIGILPIISITANNTIVTERISEIFIFKKYSTLIYTGKGRPLPYVPNWKNCCFKSYL